MVVALFEFGAAKDVVAILQEIVGIVAVLLLRFQLCPYVCVRQYNLFRILPRIQLPRLVRVM